MDFPLLVNWISWIWMEMYLWGKGCRLLAANEQAAQAERCQAAQAAPQNGLLLLLLTFPSRLPWISSQFFLDFSSCSSLAPAALQNYLLLRLPRNFPVVFLKCGWEMLLGDMNVVFISAILLMAVLAREKSNFRNLGNKIDRDGFGDAF